jgi:CheY-like chemotaxis protein
MPHRSLNILVADDERAVAESLSALLHASGHQIEWVSDGLQAFTRAIENPGKFHVLIADNTMPGLTGSELVQKLQAAAFSGKIIVLSGYLTDELEQAYRALGVEEVMRKPFDLPVVRIAIDRIGAAFNEAAED